MKKTILLICVAITVFGAYFISVQKREAKKNNELQVSEKMMVTDDTVTLVNFSPEELLEKSKKIAITLGTTTISAPVAKTESDRTRGLSGRETLSDEEGLFFVFPIEEKYGFWMKDMNFSIDIIWVNDTFEVVGIEKDVSPRTYPKVFYSPLPVRYVLEVPAGFSERYGVFPGTKLMLSSLPQ